MCNCKATEIVLGLVILVFAFWESSYSQWIIAIAAIILIIHGFMCKTLSNCMPAKPAKKPAVKKKSSRKKK